MASLINTMWVTPPDPPPLIEFKNKPLQPVQSLEQSLSCIHLGHNGVPQPKPNTSPTLSLRSSLLECLQALTPSSERSKILRTARRRSVKSRVGSPCSTLRSSPSRESSLSHRLKRYVHRNSQGSDDLKLCAFQRNPMLMELSFGRNARARGPFRPQKTNKGTSSWQLRQFAEATLGSGSLRKAVKLPEGEDVNEWLAVNSELTIMAIRLTMSES